MNETSHTRQSLTALLEPRSIAVIGASEDPARIGGKPLHFLARAGYRGDVYAVNPNRESVQGRRCYRHVSEVPEPVDVAIVAVPARHVVETVADCASRGVRSAAIFSAGFAEVGEEGEQAQRELSAIARRSGMRILGPNCLGLYNSAQAFYATFTSTLELGFPVANGVAVISQSGAYGSHVSLLAYKRGIGIHYWITTGNECDVELAELIAYTAERDDIRVIGAYAEGIRERDALLDALTLAREQGKPVVFMKVGRSRVGTEAAASHTASLAGSDAVYDAVLRQFGAYRAHDTEEFLDVIYACALGVRPRRPRLGLLTVSGGVGIQMADAAADAGLEVPPMPEGARQRLKELLPIATTRNPVDTTAQVFNQPSLIGSFLEVMLEHGDYDAVIAFFTFVAAAKSMIEPMREAVENAHSKFPDRLTILSIVAPDDIVRRYEAAGCLVFEDATRAVRAVAALRRIDEMLRSTSRRSATSHGSLVQALPLGPLSESQARTVLERAGMPLVPARLARTAEEAIAAAREIGLPVAMKVDSCDIVHKSEIGGVRLGVDSEERVARELVSMLADVARKRPAASVDGVLVSPMISRGIETIVGVQRDDVFGPVVLIGMGGVLVEILDDVSMRVAPFDEHEAEAMVRELRGWPLLAGARGRGPFDLPSLYTALARLSRFAADNADRIESVDMNPFVVLPAGEGSVALDALVVPRTERSAPGASASAPAKPKTPFPSA